MNPNALLALGLAGCAVVVVTALVGSRFLKHEPPPPPPPAPPPPETTVTGMLRYTEGFYKASLDEDVKRYGLPAVDVQALAQPLAYTRELASPRRLEAERDGFETQHLKLATKVIKEWASTGNGQGFKLEHIVLELTNKSDRPIAYRVETTLAQPDKCKSKGAIPHDALALAPGQTVRRTECLWRKNATLTVRNVEVLELTDLGYYYVSRLVPTQVLLDERTAAGHEPPKGAKACTFVPWREIQSAAEVGAGWADVIDFYARHNCDEYSFWKGYRRWTAPGVLPSHG